jgi:uncharacterized protein (UPF0332 family)
MAYENLIRQRRIIAYKASEREIQRLLEIASRDLSTAQSILDADPDWAYNIAYNAMLQSSRALMFQKGYRPRESSQHATMADFIKQTLGKNHQNLATLFDQMRRKRNRLVYEAANLVGEKETKQALALAHDFVELITTLINKEST